MRKLKLIWDFYGSDAQKIAEHHEKHLKEYLQIEGLDRIHSGVESLSVEHTIAFIVINEDLMKPIRDALKPHRGQVYGKD